MTSKKTLRGPFLFEWLSIPRSDWLTNLDFLCLQLTVDEGQLQERVIERIRFHVQGYMQVRKNCFGRKPDGTLGYHISAKKWVFFNKSDTRHDYQQQYYGAFRINSQTPMLICPFMLPNHKSLPPSVKGLVDADNWSNAKPGYAIVYEVLVEIKLSDGSQETLSLPFEFYPTDQQINMSDAPIPMPERIELSKTLVLKDMLRTYGELRATVSFPETLYLSRDTTILSQEIAIDLTWTGESHSRPELHGLVPYLLSSGSYDVVHAAPGEHVQPLLKLEQFKGREHQSQHWTDENWVEQKTGVSMKHIRCKVTIIGKDGICPSFDFCLASHKHQLRLVMDFKCPGSRLFKHQSIQMQFPVTIQLSTPASVDPDEEFMIRWWKQIPEPPDLQGMTATEFFKNPERKPTYFDLAESCAQPAPTPNVPPYTDPDIQAELNRIPAWQNKADNSVLT